MRNIKTKKSVSLENGSSAFPAINIEAGNEKEHRADVCLLFKPLFESSPAKAAWAKDASQNADPKSTEDPLVLAQQRGYEQGVTDGRQKACEMVQDKMAPVANALQETLNQYSNCHQEMVDSCTANTLRLALDIVKKISGKNALLKLKNLASERTIIYEAMRASCELNVSLNPEDKSYIETLSSCNELLKLESNSQIAFSANDNIEAGAVKCSVKEMEWSAIHRQVADALKKTMDSSDKLSID